MARLATDDVRGYRKATGALVAICVALYSLALLAAAPSLQCSAVFGPTRVLVNVQLRDFFDHELLRLVRLGLEGHLHLDINVVQHRRFWFDETISGRSTEFVFSYLKADDSFWLDQRIQVDDPLRLELERFALSFDRAPEEGTYWIEAKATLQVVTGASLSKAAGWLGPGSSSEERSGARSLLAEGLANTLANDLSHSASGTCAVKMRPKESR